MDVLTFAAQVISSIIWPLVIVYMFFIVREPIQTLILSVRQISWREFVVIVENMKDACAYLKSENKEDIKIAKEKLDAAIKKIEDNSDLYASLLIHGSNKKKKR